MDLPAAPLEDWLRDYYFQAEIDISSSGVQPYSMRQVRELTGLTQGELDDLVFDDGYSYGTPRVREAIAGRWGNGDPEAVLTTNGSSEAIFLVLTALLRPGDDVVVMDPGYHSLVQLAISLGGRPRPWRLVFDDGYQSAEAQLDGLVTPGVRAVIVNFPHNPTGATISEDILKALVRRAAEVGAYVLCDAAFSDITYDAPPLPQVSSLYDRGVSFGTFSKTIGLPGLRFGWCLGPRALLEDCVRIRDYMTLHVSPLVELVARHVLDHADALLAPRLAQARHNRELLRDWAEATADRLSLVLPAGGVAAFPRLDRLTDTSAFCRRLFHEQGVLVIPGSCFGHPQHLRLGFGGATDELAAGLDRLATSLNEPRGR